MPDYSFKAVDQMGKIKTGVRFAASVSELRASLKQTGFSLLKARQGKGLSELMDSLSTLQFGGITRPQLIELSNNMGVMLKAGVPLVTAIDELREDAGTGYIKALLGSVLENISAGDTLYQAMARRRSDFSPLYLNLVKIGEETGHLNEIFFNISRHYKRIDDLVRNVRKAMLYPLFVFIALIIATFVFLIYVFPPLFTLLDDFEVELPMITKIVMAVASTLQEQWMYIITGVVGFFITFFLLRSYKKTKFLLDWIEIRFPFLSRVLIQIHMTFFLRYLALMLSSGIDILRGLDYSSQSVMNLDVRKQLAGCRYRIMEGEMFSQSLRHLSIIPNTVIRMISVGESSGNLPEQMEYLADLYNENLERLMATVIAMIEPILILTMAGLALALIMGVLLPIYNMVSTLSSGVGTGGM